jgi:hypothetical protein
MILCIAEKAIRFLKNNILLYLEALLSLPPGGYKEVFEINGLPNNLKELSTWVRAY